MSTVPPDSKPSNWSQEEKANYDPLTTREMNKRLRTIYEDAGLDYGEDVMVEDLANRLKTAVNLKKGSINTALNAIRRSKNVELCFLVDATGSMQSHIDGVKNSISTIVDSLVAGKPNVQSKRFIAANSLRLGMVAYRDIKDQKRFEKLDFTDKVEYFKSFCSNIKAEGGDDTPEDIFGGLNEALKLNWNNDYGTKVIFHIADAPCHGKKFHDYHDSYPNGDPNGLTENFLFSQVKDKGIEYHFGKITNKTDKMVSIFSEVYGKAIMEFYVKDVQKIKSSVLVAVSTSALFSAGVTKASNQKPKIPLVATIPDWNHLPKHEGVIISFAMPASIEEVVRNTPLRRIQPKKAIFQVATNPFAHGAERYAYFARDISIANKSENIVVKEYIEAPTVNSAARYECTNQVQTIASFFAQEYMQKCIDKFGTYFAIKFLKVQTLCIVIGKEVQRFLSCERQYEKQDKFFRFTNNADYVMLQEMRELLDVKEEYIWALTAFSHWTFQVTKGYLMVVDLQGIVTKDLNNKTTAILTDPAIHCLDQTRFGRMNLGKDGMNHFFKSHQCNNYCKAFDLTLME